MHQHEDIRVNLMDRSKMYRQRSMKPPYDSIGFKPSEQHYLQYFQSVNQTKMHHNSVAVCQQALYASKINEYALPPSTIDSIINENNNIMIENVYELTLIEQATIVNLKSTIINRINNIKDFFKQSSVKRNTKDNDISDPEYYSAELAALGRLQLQPQKQNTKPTTQMLLKQHKTTQVETNCFPVEPIGNKMSKANIIRLELYREKKRKGSSSDYYKIMELKLLELLDYILQNEDDYVGLDAPTKMREVLKNLDSFKGKTIDGQSKINLLKLFFEEFRDLKMEKNGKAPKTPQKLVQQRNKDRNNLMTVKKTSIPKPFQTHNLRSQATNQAKHKSGTRSSKQVDEWIGELS